MRNFIIRVIVNAVAIYLTAYFLPGIHVSDDIVSLLLIGAIIGVVNGLVKPLLMFMTCPAVILTLGLFVLVINALMLQLAAWLAGSAFVIDGFGWAFVGGIVMGLISMLMEGVLGLDKENGRKPHDRQIP